MNKILALACSAVSIASAAAGPSAIAGGLTTLYTFTGGADGGIPFAGLLPGPNGSFFGTTTENAGTIFQLSPPAPGATSWTLTTLYTFTNGADGSFPQTLAIDSQGALYGMADHGGIRNGVCASGGNDIGCGTVFRLAPPKAGQTGWTFSVLWSFTGGADGSSPTGGVAIGAAGELYGFTYGGFTCSIGVCGGVYRLTPPTDPAAGWTETTLYSFTGGRDGGLAGSYGPPILGPNGAIYGETGIGGDLTAAACAPSGCGTVFELLPPEEHASAWRRHTLHIFHGSDGLQPVGGLSQDKAGNLYGGTNEGGRLLTCMPGNGYPNGCGDTFELSPPGSGSADWTTTILHRFSNRVDGGYPFGSPLAVGSAVYVTTSGDEQTSFGSLDELIPPSAGQKTWQVRTRVAFDNGFNGSAPVGGLLRLNGMLYGVTAGAGTGPAPVGTIFAYKLDR